MPEPQTEAGKALLGFLHSVHLSGEELNHADIPDIAARIAAIEAQARDAALAEALAAVRDYEFSHEGNYGPTDALAAIRALKERDG